MIEALCRNGADTVFGYPGGAVLPIYDELYQNTHRINHVLCAHEQNAAHAADGYARVTGKPGVVIATSGPGATNLVTGIANAYLDSVPLSPSPETWQFLCSDVTAFRRLTSPE